MRLQNVLTQSREIPGSEGESSSGRFAPGNAGGPGNPYAKRVGALRSALLDAVAEDDIRAVIATVVAEAKGGDMVAAKVLFDRVLGKPQESDLLERLEQLEGLLAARTTRGVA